MAQTCQVDSMTRNLELCGNLGVSLGDCVKMLAEGLGWLSDTNIGTRVANPLVETTKI